jgi:outer membrane receptor protein involved in Fe transport
MPKALPVADAGPADAGPADAGPLPTPSSDDAGAPEAPDAGSGLLPHLEQDVDAGHPHHEMSTTVTGRTQPKSRGPSDFALEVGALQVVPRAGGAADFLKLAPGVLLTNEGGEGHPERIFLRGFDAREGQDLELSIGGVPINQSGNLHGNGFADLTFIIPELVENLRVIEGPFDPRQGNYAVAGSADYEAGLTQRGLTAKLGVGTFNTQKLTLLFGPAELSSKTFAGVQLSKTDGFGQNRGAQSARVMTQYEGRFSDTTTWRLAANAYATQFHSAGVIREDDFEAGRLGFYDTYDARQGGDSAMASLSADLHYHQGGFTQEHQVFALYNHSRLEENFTGFLADQQLPQQSLHGQRGDLIDRESTGTTLGLKGFGRQRGLVFDRPQELEFGYFGRVDLTAGQQQRLLADTNVPYRKDLDLTATQTDVGLYVDANLSLTDWLTVRGGVRGDFFSYDVDNLCAVQSVRRPSSSNPPGDASCLSQRDFGLYREPTERITASGAAFMPRAVAVVGPFEHVSLTGSYGHGVRSIDPQYVNDNRATPFAAIRSWEGGALYADRLFTETLDVSARAVVFGTRVDKDLVFSEQDGRNILGGATNRVGALAQGRARGGFYDVSANVTWVRSTFEDTGNLVPYVPDLVMRLDGALFHELPWRFLERPVKGSVGLGMNYVGRRALPYGQRSDVIFVTDLSGELAWRNLTLQVAATNLFNTQYRLAEFNYAADFHTTSPYPTLVPSRLFAAGAPRQVMVTLSFNLGGSNP